MKMAILTGSLEKNREKIGTRLARARGWDGPG